MRALVVAACDYNNNNLTARLQSKHKKVISCTIKLLKKKLLTTMINGDGNKTISLTLMPIDAFYLDKMLRGLCEDGTVQNPYIKNILLTTANELDQKLISL